MNFTAIDYQSLAGTVRAQFYSCQSTTEWTLADQARLERLSLRQLRALNQVVVRSATWAIWRFEIKGYLRASAFLVYRCAQRHISWHMGKSIALKCALGGRHWAQRIDGSLTRAVYVLNVVRTLCDAIDTFSRAHSEFHEYCVSVNRRGQNVAESIHRVMNYNVQPRLQT